MILFPHRRTRRLSVRLTELTLGEGIALCNLPGERHERTTTELLRFIARDAERPRDSYVTDPLLWTVQERVMLMCTYLAHVTADGPDFAVGESRLSDYIDFVRDSTADEIDLGVVAEESFVMRPLLGLHSNALESLCAKRGDWIIGAMACRMFVKGSPEAATDLADLGDVGVQDWVSTRMERLKALPESVFEELFIAYKDGDERMAHFFNIDFDDDGLLFLAPKKEGVAQHMPARFRPASCISELSRSLS